MIEREKGKLSQQLENIISLLVVSGRTCKSIGLFNGKMGMVVFLFHVARQTKNISFADIASELIDEIQDDIHADSPLSYRYGLSGIGVGIEYLAQQHFLTVDTDDVLEDFDRIFFTQIYERKLYLSFQELTDFKRYFLVRSENAQTKKRSFLHKAIDEISILQELQKRVSGSSVNIPYPYLSIESENWGLEGYAGKGLTLLSELNPRHSIWLNFK